MLILSLFSKRTSFARKSQLNEIKGLDGRASGFRPGEARWPIEPRRWVRAFFFAGTHGNRPTKNPYNNNVLPAE